MSESPFPRTRPWNAAGISGADRSRKWISSGDSGGSSADTSPVKKASESAHVTYSVSA